MTNLPGQEITNELNGKDDNQNQKGRKKGHIIIVAQVTVGKSNLPQTTCSDSSCHGSVANQGNQGKCRHTNQVRQTLTQIDKDNIPESRT